MLGRLFEGLLAELRRQEGVELLADDAGVVARLNGQDALDDDLFQRAVLRGSGS